MDTKLEVPFNSLTDDALESLVYTIGEAETDEIPPSDGNDNPPRSTDDDDLKTDDGDKNKELGNGSDEDSKSDDESKSLKTDDGNDDDDDTSSDTTENSHDEKIGNTDGDSEDDKGENLESIAEEYKALFAPLKASGKTIEIKSVEEARKLMSFGVDYHKNMNKISKHKRLLQTLDKTGLLESKDELNLLLEVRAGNVDAIKEIIKRNKVNTSDLDSFDADEEKPYTPKDHIVPEAESGVLEVIERIKDTPEYPKTMKLVSETWDEKSKEMIVANPDILEVINIQMGNGDFDKVMAELERAKLFGNIPKGMSDVDAYGLIASKVLSVKGSPEKAPKSTNRKPPDKSRVVSKGNKARADKGSSLINKPFRELSDEELDEILEQLHR